MGLIEMEDRCENPSTALKGPLQCTVSSDNEDLKSRFVTLLGPWRAPKDRRFRGSKGHREGQRGLK